MPESTNNSSKPSRSSSRQRGQPKSTMLGTVGVPGQVAGNFSNSSSFGWRSTAGTAKEFNFAKTNEYDLPMGDAPDHRYHFTPDLSDTGHRVVSKRRDGVSQTTGLKFIKSKKLVTQTPETTQNTDSLASKKLHKDRLGDNDHSGSDKKKRKPKPTESSKVSQIGSNIDSKPAENRRSQDRENSRQKLTKTDTSPDSVSATPIMKPKGIFKSSKASRSNSRSKSKRQTRHGSPGGSGFGKSDDITEDIKVAPHLLAPIMSVLSKIQTLQKNEAKAKRKANDSKNNTSGKASRAQSQTRTRPSSNTRLNVAERTTAGFESRRASEKNPKSKSRSRSQKSKKREDSPKTRSSSKSKKNILNRDKHIIKETSEQLYFTGKTRKKPNSNHNTGAVDVKHLKNLHGLGDSGHVIPKAKSQKLSQKLLAKKLSANHITVQPTSSPALTFARPQTPPTSSPTHRPPSPQRPWPVGRPSSQQASQPPASPFRSATKQPIAPQQTTYNPNLTQQPPKTTHDPSLFAAVSPPSKPLHPQVAPDSGSTRPQARHPLPPAPATSQQHQDMRPPLFKPPPPFLHQTPQFAQFGPQGSLQSHPNRPEATTEKHNQTVMMDDEEPTCMVAERRLSPLAHVQHAQPPAGTSAPHTPAHSATPLPLLTPNTLGNTQSGISRELLGQLLAEARSKHIEREMLEILGKVTGVRPSQASVSVARESVKLEDSIQSLPAHSIEPQLEIKEVFTFKSIDSDESKNRTQERIQQQNAPFSTVEPQLKPNSRTLQPKPTAYSTQHPSSSLGRLDYTQAIPFRPKVLNIDLGGVNLHLASQSNDLSRHSSQASIRTEADPKNTARSRSNNQPPSPHSRFEESWVNPPPQPTKADLLLQIKDRTQTALKTVVWPQKLPTSNASDDGLSQGNRSEGSFSVSSNMKYQAQTKQLLESSEGSQTKNILIRDEVDASHDTKVLVEDEQKKGLQTSDEKRKASEDTDKDSSSEPPNSIRIPAAALLEGHAPSGLGSPEGSDTKQPEQPTDQPDSDPKPQDQDFIELDEDLEGPQAQTMAITPLLLDNLVSDIPGLSSLSPEEQACSIGDFILENLLIEVFACGSEPFLAKILTAGKKLSAKLAGRETAEVSRYLSQVFTIINESPEYQLEIYTRLNTPVLHSDSQRLLLAAPGLPAEALEGAAAMGYESVLNIQLYIQLEELLRDTEYTSRGLGLSEVEREHIHHKLLFDALNEQLDYSRAGGLKGLPPSFFQEYKTPRRISPEDCARILESAKAVVLGWTSEKAGLLSEHLPSSELPEALEMIREDVLLKQLAGYAHTLEEKWAEFSDEQLEVILNLADQIEDDLLTEAVQDMLKISAHNTLELEY